jgi:hypothetical protein
VNTGFCIGVECSLLMNMSWPKFTTIYYIMVRLSFIKLAIDACPKCFPSVASSSFFIFSSKVPKL